MAGALRGLRPVTRRARYRPSEVGGFRGGGRGCGRRRQSPASCRAPDTPSWCWSRDPISKRRGLPPRRARRQPAGARSPTTIAKQPNTFRATEAEYRHATPAVRYGRMVGGGTVALHRQLLAFPRSGFHRAEPQGAGRPGPASTTGRSPTPTSSRTTPRWNGRSASRDWPAPIRSTRPGAGPIRCRRLPIKSVGVLAERAAKALGWHRLPRADGDPLGALPGPGRLRAVRLLRDLRLRDGRQVEHSRR